MVFEEVSIPAASCGVFEWNKLILSHFMNSKRFYVFKNFIGLQELL